MRFVTFESEGLPKLGVRLGDEVVDLSKADPSMPNTLLAVLEADNGIFEEAKIAAFWDCNPYVSYHKGHAMFAIKKITPGGHWIGITKIATELANDSFDEAINSYLQVSIALFDGFISCWDTKWNTLVVRPETLINKYIDEEWLPKLQTPPFPEYTSGHSVISKASAVVLTKKDLTKQARNLKALLHQIRVHIDES